jgi:hypothetical protein
MAEIRRLKEEILGLNEALKNKSEEIRLFEQILRKLQSAITISVLKLLGKNRQASGGRLCEHIIRSHICPFALAVIESQACDKILASLDRIKLEFRFNYLKYQKYKL